jgi:deoxycytidine triphosphate deaminase
MMLKLESQRTEKIYDTDTGSPYQHQALTLSKQFRKG